MEEKEGERRFAGARRAISPARVSPSPSGDAIYILLDQLSTLASFFFSKNLSSSYSQTLFKVDADPIEQQNKTLHEEVMIPRGKP